MNLGTGGTDSVVKSTGCSRKEPGINSQHLHVSSQPSVSPTLTGDPTSPAGLLRHQAYDAQAGTQTR